MVGIDVYIPHQKYQVKPHSSPWFSAAFAAATVHRNHFFRLYQKDKSSEFKVKFRQARNRCTNVALGTFGKLLIVFSTKVNLQGKSDLPDDVVCDIAIYADDTTPYSKCDQVSDL